MERKFDISHSMPLIEESYKEPYHWALRQQEWQDYRLRVCAYFRQTHNDELFCQNCFALLDDEKAVIHHPYYDNLGSWPWEYPIYHMTIYCRSCHNLKIHTTGDWRKRKNIHDKIHGKHVSTENMEELQKDRYSASYRPEKKIHISTRRIEPKPTSYHTLSRHEIDVGNKK